MRKNDSKRKTGKISTGVYKIAVIPGDGVGPEVTQEAFKVFKAASEKFGFKYELVNYDFGAQRYLSTKELLPDSALAEFRQMNAIYMGAIGNPKVAPGVLERGILLKLRFELDQYVNLRPVKLYPGVQSPLKDKSPEDIDFVVIRENTEGLYSGVGGFFKKDTPDEIAVQEDINTRRGVERIIKYAFNFTQRRNKDKKLTLCDKSNVLTYGHDLWQRVFHQVADKYPDITKDHAYVDATVMWMVKNPEFFDVIVTCNLFGDIITDLGAMIQGGMGIAASGNINPEGVSMFEPVHGSSPKYAGKNTICPLAAIASMQLMLDNLGEPTAAQTVEKALIKALSEGHIKNLSAGKGLPTDKTGDLIAKFVKGE